MAVITAPLNFVSTEMVLAAAAALLSTFLLLVISLKSFLAYFFRCNDKIEQIDNTKMMDLSPSAGNTKLTGSNPSICSFITCCNRNSNENARAKTKHIQKQTTQKSYTITEQDTPGATHFLETR